MKTKQLLFLSLLGLSFYNTNAQVTQSTNAISATSYVGTSNDNDVTFKRNTVNAGVLSTTKTSFGVNSFATPNSVSIGVGAGQFSSGTYGYNIYIGQNAGKGENSTNTNSGNHNIFLGNSAGIYNTAGNNNIFLGEYSGYSNTSGSENIFIGIGTGSNNYSGNGNVCIGNGSNTEHESTINNTYIGNNAGSEASGSNNVFIGNKTGFYESSSNRLIVDNSQTTSPLIWGDFALDQLKLNAQVGIGFGFGDYPTTVGGVNVSNYNLFVRGGILTEEVRIRLATGWADYVFNKNYNLKPLHEVENFIKANGHLPNVPSAKEVKENGIELGEIAKIQQEKIEELTLYAIEQNKTLQSQAKEIEELKAQMKLLINRK